MNDTSSASSTINQTVKKKLLIIEDDFFLVDLLTNMAVSFGFETDKALDGAEALEKNKNNVYDLALIDIMIPKLDGISIIRAIKNDPRTAKTICVVFTNLEDDDAMKDAMSAGAYSYLIKVKYTPLQVIKYLDDVPLV